jgi:hypothetical protein
MKKLLLIFSMMFVSVYLSANTNNFKILKTEYSLGAKLSMKTSTVNPSGCTFSTEVSVGGVKAVLVVHGDTCEEALKEMNKALETLK